VTVERPIRAAVLGTGSWGTTFAAVLADAGCEVTLWGRRAEVVDQISTEHRNDAYLPGHDLPVEIAATTDARAALAGADVVAIAVPAQNARSVLEPLRDVFTDRRMSEVIVEALGIPESHVAVISGPNLAHEIIERQPTATVVASVNDESAHLVARASSSSYFRPYTNADVVGVELCGAVKNVIALAVGIAQGTGYGQNTAATVITRGLVEITRLGLALGAKAETFAGLAGMGDLVATCSSPLSRNHSLGVRVGQGMALDEALELTRGTAEGVKSCRSVLELARATGVEMPITQAVVAVLYGGLPVQEMAQLLLNRPHRAEGI